MARLSVEEERELLRLARASIAAGLRGEKLEPEPPESEALAAPGGAFVSLHERGQLRGCIGILEAVRPLYRTVAEMARSAAFQDPRFPPLAPDELAAVHLEVSVLTPLRRAAADEVEVGRHGLVAARGGRRGVLLPQVPVQCGWDRETFLDQTCCKAGLPRGAWKKGADLYVFEAQVFGEEGQEA